MKPIEKGCCMLEGYFSRRRFHEFLWKSEARCRGNTVNCISSAVERENDGNTDLFQIFTK